MPSRRKSEKADVGLPASRIGFEQLLGPRGRGGDVQAATAIKQSMTGLDRRRVGDAEGRMVIGSEGGKAVRKGQI